MSVVRAVLVPFAAVLLAACAGPAAGPTAVGTSARAAGTPAASTPAALPSPPAPALISAVYGYAASPPADWTVAPATAAWDGGDVDHTAEYADRLVDPAGNEYFVVGTTASAPLAEVTDDHLAWLAGSRGCPPASSRTATTIDGAPAERMSIHCPDGVFGPTLVSKATTVHDGDVLIVTAFSPDDGSDDLASFDDLVASIRWTAP